MKQEFTQDCYNGERDESHEEGPGGVVGHLGQAKLFLLTEKKHQLSLSTYLSIIYLKTKIKISVV